MVRKAAKEIQVPWAPGGLRRNPGIGEQVMGKASGIRRVANWAASVLVGVIALRSIVSSKSSTERGPGSEMVQDLGRGRNARSPLAIPRLGWKDILWRTYAQLGKDRVLLVAAGVTFYCLLSLFPALTAFVSIYGFFADPQLVLQHIEQLSGFMPAGAVDIIGSQMERIADQPSQQLGFGLVAGLGIALWSANNGMKALFDATNVAYNEEEKRGFFLFTAMTFLFTIGAIVTLILAMGALVVLPIILGLFGLEGATRTLLQVGRWPVLLTVIIIAVSLIYRYGPSRTRAGWRWIWPGSVLASVLWAVASLLFSWYVANFDSYNEVYGSLGAVIAFMVWMWLSATIVIMGAEFNAEIEHQTRRDSTRGRPSPMGARGAEVADNLGPRAG